MNWLILTLISAVAYAFAEIIGKYVSDEKSEPLFIGIVSAIFTAFASGLFLFFEPLVFPTQGWAIAGLLASAAVVAVGIGTYYKGLKYSDISEFSLLSRSSVLMRVIGGILLFQETFSAMQIVGGVLIMVSVFSLTWEGKKFHFEKGSRLALVTAILFTFGALFDKAVISSYSPILYTFLVYFFTVLFMFPAAFFHYRKGAKLPQKKTITALFFTGSLYGISAYCIYAAFLSKGPLSLISLASQLEIPITILWGIFIMKEQKRMIPKLISMCLLIIGIILLK